MATTMLLDQTLWDLVTDTSGNWAVASEPYSVAQDVASAIKTFLGECYYDTTIGIPYFQQILGQFPSLQFLRAQFVGAALTVPLVTSAQCFFGSLKDREISGQVQFTYTLSGAAAGETAGGLVTFVGSNQGVVTFVGSNGAFVEFAGS